MRSIVMIMIMIMIIIIIIIIIIMHELFIIITVNQGLANPPP